MTAIKDIATISEEVLRGDIFGIIKIYNISDPDKPESSPDRILSITYPTQPLCQTLKACGEKFSGERAQGTFIFTGGYGTGKSHNLLAIYHLLSSPEKGRDWLDRWKLDFSLPEKSQVIVSHLLDEDPDFLWDPLFEKASKNDLLNTVRDFPTISQVRSLLNEQPMVVILDELEAWYDAIDQPSRKERNLNFLQNLSETAADPSANLVVFASVYGRNKEILARLGREKIFLKDLGASEDKVKVVLFRLFKEIDKKKAREVTESYLQVYLEQKESLQSATGSLDNYRSRLLETYPLHPELVDVLFESYGSSRNYQNTRGILYLLSGVLKRAHDTCDLLLPADVDPEYDEVHDDLFQLNQNLLSRCLEDIRRTTDESLSRGILSTILLHSFVPERNGCEEDRIFLGNLRPGLNINELYRVLGKLERTAWYLWRTNGKYVIRTEENLPVSINSRAQRLLNKEGSERAKSKLAEMIKKELGVREVYVYPLDEIPDTRHTKTVISTRYAEPEDLEARQSSSIYYGREWRNSLIFIRPKVAGDLSENQDLLLRAQRLLVCTSIEKELGQGKQTQLNEIRSREEDELKSKIRGSFGEWMKPGGRGEKVYFRPVDVQFSSEDILSKVLNSFGSETIEQAILADLEDVEEQGRRFDALKTSFLKQLGKPIILEEGMLKQQVRALCEKDVIVLECGKNLYTGDNLPGDIHDDMILYLKSYGPTIQEPRLKEKGKAGKEPAGYEEGTTTVEVEEGVKIISLETSSHSTPFNLQSEVERRLLQADRVRKITITMEAQGLEDAGKLETLTTQLEDGSADVSVTVTLTFPTPVAKSRLLNILEDLPIPTNGTISAQLEVERS